MRVSAASARPQAAVLTALFLSCPTKRPVLTPKKMHATAIHRGLAPARVAAPARRARRSSALVPVRAAETEAEAGTIVEYT